MISMVTVRAAPGDPRKGILNVGGRVFPCALGRSGMGAPKREGDGKTPVAAMRPLYGWFRADRQPRPASRLPLRPITPRDGWCDAPGDANYNRPVRLPFSASHETMMRDDRLYDVCIVLDWNIHTRKRNRGSAIFLHIARPGFPPTEGCIAVAPETMRWLLPRIGRETVIQTVV